MSLDCFLSPRAHIQSIIKPAIQSSKRIKLPNASHHICQTIIITRLPYYGSSATGLTFCPHPSKSSLNLTGVILWDVTQHAAPLFKAPQHICSSSEVKARAFQWPVEPYAMASPVCFSEFISEDTSPLTSLQQHRPPYPSQVPGTVFPQDSAVTC